MSAPTIVIKQQAAGHWSWICTEHRVGTVTAVGAPRTALDDRIAEHMWAHGKPVPLW